MKPKWRMWSLRTSFAVWNTSVIIHSDKYLGHFVEGFSENGESEWNMRIVEVNQNVEEGVWILVVFPAVVPYDVERLFLRQHQWSLQLENRGLDLHHRELLPLLGLESTKLGTSSRFPREDLSAPCQESGSRKRGSRPERSLCSTAN